MVCATARAGDLARTNIVNAFGYRTGDGGGVQIGASGRTRFVVHARILIADDRVIGSPDCAIHGGGRGICCSTQIRTRSVVRVRNNIGAPAEAQVHATVGASVATICPLFALGSSGRTETKSLYDE
jgi:hypothetical protein